MRCGCIDAADLAEKVRNQGSKGVSILVKSKFSGVIARSLLGIGVASINYAATAIPAQAVSFIVVGDRAFAEADYHGNLFVPEFSKQAERYTRNQSSLAFIASGINLDSLGFDLASSGMNWVTAISGLLAGYDVDQRFSHNQASNTGWPNFLGSMINFTVASEINHASDSPVSEGDTQQVGLQAANSVLPWHDAFRLHGVGSFHQSVFTSDGTNKYKAERASQAIESAAIDDDNDVAADSEGVKSTESISSKQQVTSRRLSAAGAQDYGFDCPQTCSSGWQTMDSMYW